MHYLSSYPRQTSHIPKHGNSKSVESETDRRIWTYGFSVSAAEAFYFDFLPLPRKPINGLQFACSDPSSQHVGAAENPHWKANKAWVGNEVFAAYETLLVQSGERDVTQPLILTHDDIFVLVMIATSHVSHMRDMKRNSISIDNQYHDIRWV